MGIDIAHLLRLHPGIGQGLGHTGRTAGSPGGGGGDVVGVAVGAVARHLGIDLGSAGLCVLIFLQHQHSGALAHDKAAALRVKGDRSAGGVRVLAEGLHGGEGRLSAAAQHHIAIPVPDVAEGIAHGVGAPSAGGDHAGAHSLKAKANGDLPGGHVGDDHRNDKGGHGVIAPALSPAVGLGHSLKAADAAGADDPAAGQVLPLPIQAAVVHGLLGGDEGKLGKAVHLLGLPLAQNAVDVQILHLSGQLYPHVRAVIPGDGADAALAVLDRLPALRHAVSNGVHRAHAGDHDPTFFHSYLLIRSQVAFPLLDCLKKPRSVSHPRVRKN